MLVFLRSIILFLVMLRNEASDSCLKENLMFRNDAYVKFCGIGGIWWATQQVL